MGEPLYRVSTGNYEYRLVLRCRQEARARFAKMRKDVLEKIELLDQKHGLLLLLSHSIRMALVMQSLLVKEVISKIISYANLITRLESS